MTANLTASNARLLFVIDNDFGELNMALLFVHGRALASRTTVMLPPRLFDLNGTRLPLRTLPYRSYDDLAAAIEAEAPDIVFLLTGYMLPAHRLISVTELERLIDRLHARRCRIVTSDPFWGLLTVPAPRIAAPFKALAQVGAVVKDLVQLYVAPFEVGESRGVSFFNPSFVDASIAPVPPEFWPSVGVADRPAGRRFWLFPLTLEDYKTQLELIGQEAFVSRVVTLLDDTVASGRTPVMLAPDECLQAVVRSRTIGTAAMLPYCDYGLFMSLLIHAEYVFYWNVIPASGHLRLIRGLTQFSFDAGHVDRVVEDWLERTLRYYYAGQQPLRVEPGTNLCTETLSSLEAEYRPVADRIRTNLAAAPSPEEMVDELLARDARRP